MGSPATLPMTDIVDIVVQVSPQSPAQPTFNQGLIVGPSAHISPATRVKQYSSLSGMAADGFLTTDPEYIAAQLYFSQQPAPLIVWIGRHDNTGGETVLQAVQACRAASFQWWGFAVTDAVKTDQIALAGWAQTAQPPVMYFYRTSDADVPTNTAGNIFASLKSSNYSRAFGIYSTTQSGLYPNNNYAGSAALGAAMGMNTGLAGSAFTMKFKQLVGIVPDPLDQTTVGNIKTNSGNIYVNRGNAYTMLEEGTVANGQFLDEVLNLDMLVSNMQYNVMNLLFDNPKIPQTDAGQTQLIQAVNDACEASRIIGFLASGTWEGVPILKLNPGDAVPGGYLSQSPRFSTQTASDRAARKAMPIYTAITEAGSMHSILIGIYVER